MTESSPQRTIDMRGILGETFGVTTSNFYLLLFFIFAVKTPTYLFRLLLPWQDFLSVFGVTTNALRWGFDILTTLSWLFSMIGVAFITQKHLDGEAESFHSVITFCVSRFTDVVWTYLLLLLVLTVRIFALIIPGIIYANTSSFALFASALRQNKGSEAIRYSENLVQGQWWNVFGYQLLVFLIIFTSTIAIWIITRNSQQIDLFTWLAYQSLTGALEIFAIVWQVLFFRRVETCKVIWESNDAKVILAT